MIAVWWRVFETQAQYLSARLIHRSLGSAPNPTTPYSVLPGVLGIQHSLLEGAAVEQQAVLALICCPLPMAAT